MRELLWEELIVDLSTFFQNSSYLEDCFTSPM